MGRKNGKACNVFNAAKHFVTVTVLQATTKIQEQKMWKNIYYKYQEMENQNTQNNEEITNSKIIAIKSTEQELWLVH